MLFHPCWLSQANILAKPPGPQVSAAHMCMATALIIQSGRFVASFRFTRSDPAPFNAQADGWGTAIVRALRSALVPARVVVRQPAEGLKP